MLSLSQLAQVFARTHHVNRRLAKQYLRSAGLPCSAVDLDATLATIADHPQRSVIEAEAASLSAELRARYGQQHGAAGE